ncbi:ABC transporter ATP-binding protein [Nonomuraea sp. CA-143628]|uniref:ABC transporter ATP-binding protein n=1 Tax=Nonomuraea sp. CA-143628 TaxID=3239997 RepID=UPI003D93187D
MPALKFEQVSKSYGVNEIINSFDAEVEDGEFLVLLGPSGCGKSTLLRMIAGLTDITSGKLLFDGEPANDWPVAQRKIAFVFQSYALYPHMSVRDNIAFPLVMEAFRPQYHVPVINAIMRRRIAKRPDVREQVENLARSFELDHLLDRRPANLSGGQRQRVALARALIRDPSLYLLDEPLSNLDAKLRAQMRAQISALHHEVGKTFIYVTHDQIEAMTMATRIAIMDKGVVQQFGTPDDIYKRPANTFVARFVGSPPMNLLPVLRDGPQLRHHGGATWTHTGPLPTGGEHIFGIRPEKLRAVEKGAAGAIPVEVMSVERLGGEAQIGCRVIHEHQDHERRLAGSDELLWAKVAPDIDVSVGDHRRLDYTPADVTWFDPATTQRVDLETLQGAHA